MTSRRVLFRAPALACLAMLLPAQASASDPDGRALYRGHAGWAAGRDATEQRLPERFAACARCHGALGEGSTEGGTAVPPVRYAALVQPRDGLPAFANDDAIRTAILAGTGRAGRPLSPAMPRYRLEAAEATALLAYLRRLGTSADLPRGVGPESVTLGTLLPLSGPAASTGRAVLDGLREGLAEMPVVHGRRLLLITEDGATDPAAALTRLLARPVFALMGSLWAPDARMEALLAAARVPHLGSLLRRMAPVPVLGWNVDLLAPLSVQQGALRQALGQCGGSSMLAVRLTAEEEDSLRIRWFDDAGALQRAFGAISEPGCVGSGIGVLTGPLPPGWRRFVVLPMPGELIGDATWRRLGRAAARLTAELLARAGPLLHERAALDVLPATAGFEPLPGLPVRFGRNRRHGWDPEVIEIPDLRQSRAP